MELNIHRDTHDSVSIVTQHRDFSRKFNGKNSDNQIGEVQNLIGSLESENEVIASIQKIGSISNLKIFTKENSRDNSVQFVEKYKRHGSC